MLLTAIVYWPVAHCGFIWDDESYVEHNQTLRSVQGLLDMWFRPGAVPQYYPLVHTTFWIEYHLWGLDPRGYHLVNLTLHCTSVVLVWRLLARLAVPGAWLAAAVFAVHPVGVESVAWITERKNVLSLVLALGSMLAFLRFSPPDEQVASSNGEAPQRWRFYALSIVLYLAALLSKTVTASVPAVLLVIAWWKRGQITKRDLVATLPMFVLGVLLGGVTVWLERTHVGASGDEWRLSGIERVLVAGRALWFYAGKLAWPHPLVFFYPRSTINASAAWQYLFPLAAVAVIVALWLVRGRLGRGPLAAVLVFCGVLAPALGFFDVYPFRFSFVADHFQYHASIALIALAVAAGTLWCGHAAKALPALAPAVCAVALLAGFGWIAHEKIAVYHDLVTLFTDTLRWNPDAWPAHHNLGNLRQLAGDAEGAAAHFREALRIKPDDARVHASLGGLLAQQEQFTEAESELNLALAGDLDSAGKAIAHLNLAEMRITQKRYDDAFQHFERALELEPEYFSAVYKYGLALWTHGDHQQAVERLRAALAIYPDYAPAQHELGVMLTALGQREQAIEPLAKAVALDPVNETYRADLDAARAAPAK